MDPLIQPLYGIPILGVVFQLAGYLIAVLPSISPIILQTATPVALPHCAASCASGRVWSTSGSKGIMIAAAFVGWYAGVVDRRRVRRQPGAVLRFAGPDRRGRAWRRAGVLISLLHAWLAISVRADQIISGTIINILAFGLTGYLIACSRNVAGRGRRRSTTSKPPDEMSRLPVVGWLLDVAGSGADCDVAHRHRHRLPDRCSSARAGDCAAGRRRTSQGGRHGRHRRHPRPLPERPGRRRCSRPSAGRI